MDILSLCVYAILSVILLLIIYRAYNYHFTENFTSKTPTSSKNTTSSNLSKIQKNVCPKPPPCATCPIPQPCPSCPPHEPCPTCPIPEPCPSCPPPISENKFSFEEFNSIRKLGKERLKKSVMDHLEKIGLIKLLNDYNISITIDILWGDNEKIVFHIVSQKNNGRIRKEKFVLPIYNNYIDDNCTIDLYRGKYGCISLESF